MTGSIPPWHVSPYARIVKMNMRTRGIAVFHAEPNACPVCGPTLTLLDGEGVAVDCADPVEKTRELLSQGFIAAIKGLGGFHLAVDATSNQAVENA